MQLWEIITMAVGLGMDACAVAICKGLAMKKATLREGVICGLWFGGFQGLMPLIGYFLGSLFASAIERFDHWIAFGLLAIIGINMLRETFSKDDCDCEGSADLSVKTMFVMAVATSIDAMASGIILAEAPEQGTQVNIFVAVAIIGAITFVMSVAGVKLGNAFGKRFEKVAQILGGVILILLGIKMLAEGLMTG